MTSRSEASNNKLSEGRNEMKQEDSEVVRLWQGECEQRCGAG